MFTSISFRSGDVKYQMNTKKSILSKMLCLRFPVSLCLDGGLGLKRSGIDLKSHLGCCHSRGQEGVAQELGSNDFCAGNGFSAVPEFRRCNVPAPAPPRISGNLVHETPPSPDARTSTIEELIRYSARKTIPRKQLNKLGTQPIPKFRFASDASARDVQLAF